MSSSDIHKLTCPACGAKLNVKPSHAGKRAKCPGCAVVLTISPQLDGLTVLQQSADATTPSSTNAHAATTPAQTSTAAATSPSGDRPTPKLKTRGESPTSPSQNPAKPPPRRKTMPSAEVSASHPQPSNGASRWAEPDDSFASHSKPPATAHQTGQNPQAPPSQPRKMKNSTLVLLIAIPLLFMVTVLGVGTWAVFHFLGDSSPAEIAAVNINNSTDPAGLNPAADAVSQEKKIKSFLELQDFMPDHCVSVTLFHPKEVLQHELGKEYVKRNPDYHKRGLTTLPGLKNPAEIELVMIAHDTSSSGDGNVHIIRRDRKINLTDFFYESQLDKRRNKLETEELYGYTVSRLVGPDSQRLNEALCQIDERTGLLGTYYTIQRILERKSRPRISQRMSRFLDEVEPSAPLSLVMDLGDDTLGNTPYGRAMGAQVKPYLDNVNGGRIEVTLDKEIHAHVSMLCRDVDSARKLWNTLIGSLALLKLQLKSEGTRAETKPVEDVLELINITSKRDTVNVDISLSVAALFGVVDAINGVSEITPNNMGKIKEAMSKYKREFKVYPPAEWGQQRNKGLSWRVALLPYLGEKGLYDQFRLDEPWNSPHNSLLVSKMPDVYGPHNPRGLTRFVTLRHPTTLFPAGGKSFGEDNFTGLNLIPDFDDQTILFVQAGPRSAVVWTKPDDLNFDPARPKSGLDDGSGKFWAMFADGMKYQISLSIEDRVLRAMSTPEGRERLVPGEINDAKMRR